MVATSARMLVSLSAPHFGHTASPPPPRAGHVAETDIVSYSRSTICPSGVPKVGQATVGGVTSGGLFTGWLGVTRANGRPVQQRFRAVEVRDANTPWNAKLRCAKKNDQNSYVCSRGIQSHPSCGWWNSGSEKKGLGQI